jgi:YafQ family addiction module toxin component
MYKIESTDKFKKITRKLFKKDSNQLKAIENKIPQILSNPYRFKPLRNKLSGVRRVHIMKSFVLTFEINEKEKIVRFLDYDHHDNIYD